MPSVQIHVCDETVGGDRSPGFTLDFLNERITVRELIRERVYQEVREYNAQSPTYLRSLVQPTDAEATLNGYRLRKARKIDWEEQYRLALDAFTRNGFFMLVDDRQAESLDDEILVTPQTIVSFVKLTPLVGG